MDALLAFLGLQRVGGDALSTAPTRQVSSRTSAGSTAEAGADDEGPNIIQAPWEETHCAPSLDSDDVRTFLIRSLFEELDGCVAENDRNFLTRLVRVLGAESLDFPLFPDVAWKLDTLLRDGDPPIVQVAELVRREPEMVRRVWKQASSVVYARRVSSLDHAIARIGFDSLWRIAMAACLYSPVFRVPGFQPQIDQARAQGIVTAEVVNWLSKASKGDLYLAGLLHTVGKLVVYRSALPQRGQPGPSLDLVEQIARRFHAGIGVLVMRDWKMADAVVAAVGFHPDPTRAPTEHLGVAHLVRVGAIATYTAEEARRHNDCGGLQVLVELSNDGQQNGLSFEPARTVVKAHEIFDSIADMYGVDGAADKVQASAGGRR